MNIPKYFLKVANTLVSYIVILSMITAGLYAGYALWDNSLVYGAVDNVQADMIKLKPIVDEKQRPTFDELFAINKDVVGWVTLDNTNVDYPVLQGENNLTYFNMDIYGNFSLGGSIYLDSRNNSDFKDNYSLLYGHDMDLGRMFGDLSLYKEEEFFNANQSGSLTTPEKVYDLKVYAILMVNASDEKIFNITMWNGDHDLEGLIQYAEDEALYLNNAAIEGQPMEKLQILSFTTCTYEFTDARTVILIIFLFLNII